MTARFFSSVPELAVTSVAGFSLGPMVLLLAGHFTPWPVIVTGLIGAVVADWLCLRNREPFDPDRPELDRHAGLWTLAALVFVGVWVLLNWNQVAENVYATRDPATYNITARWLMDNPSAHIPTNPEIFGSPAGATSQSAGFSDDGPGQVYSQGNHLMPALAAVMGWVTNVSGMFKADLLLGGLALLALFGLARRIVGSPLALLVTATMSVTMPMIYVSRDMYSEPLMMLFLMGSLSLLHRAINYGRRIDFGLAGFVAGCAALVRIDSYAALLALVVSAIALLVLAAPDHRRSTVGNVLTMVGAGAVPAFIGWLDVSRLSSGYYRDQHHNITMELLAILLLVVLAPVVVAVAWRPAVRDRLAIARGPIASIAALLLVVTFVFLLSRPLWYTGRWRRNLTLETWQKLDGVEPDGSRNYAEQTVRWLGEFLGWPVVLLAVAGYVLLILALVLRRDYALVAVLPLGLAMSALYLWNPQITPDLPWAMRRFVPVILPLLLIAAAVALRVLLRRRGAGRILGVALCAFMFAIPAANTWPMRDVAEAVGQYSQVQAICDAVGPKGAIVILDKETQAAYAQTVRSYCDVPSIGVFAVPADLEKMTAAVSEHGRTLYVLSREESAVLCTALPPPPPLSSVRTDHWPNVINRVPNDAGFRQIDIYLGMVEADGHVKPISPPK